MKLKLFYLFAIVLFCLTNNLDAGLSMGLVGNIEVTAIYECPDKEKYINDKMSVKMQLREVENGRALFGTLTSQYDLDNSITYIAEFKRMENGGWKKIIDTNGRMCTDLQRYCSKFWSIITSAVKPKPENSCPLKAGNYSIENFQAETKDVGLRATFYGKLLLKITSFDKDGKPWFCFIAEANSKRR